MPRPSPVVCVILLATVGACVDEPESKISGEPGSASDVMGSFVGTPLLSLGGAAASGPTQFAGLRSLIVTVDGSIWVADGQSQEIRVFDQQGTHQLTTGGRGDGPGEFRDVRLTRLHDENRVAAVDRRLGRVTFYSGDGRLLDSERWAPSALVAPIGFTGSGALVAMTQPGVPGNAFRDGVYRDTARVLVWNDLDADPDTLAWIPGIMFATRPDGATVMPFSVGPDAEVVDGEIIATGGPDFTLLRVDGRGEKASWSAPRAARPRTSAAQASHRAFVEATYPESAVRGALDALEHPELPVQLPGYDRLVGTEDGGVWARVWAVDRTGPREWDVFNSTGVFVGTATPPEGFEPHFVQDHLVTGVRRDDLGVEYLEQYALARR